MISSYCGRKKKKRNKTKLNWIRNRKRKQKHINNLLCDTSLISAHIQYENVCTSIQLTHTHSNTNIQNVCMFASLALCGFCFTYLISYQVLEKQFQTVQIAIEKFIVYPFPSLSHSFSLFVCLSLSHTTLQLWNTRRIAKVMQSKTQLNDLIQLKSVFMRSI